jgi:hypothetical protein
MLKHEIKNKIQLGKDKKIAFNKIRTKFNMKIKLN